MCAAMNGTTKVIGIFGYPVEHSFSPAMHNAAFAHLGLNYVYVPFPVAPARLDEAVRGIRALGLTGVNVTIPHKGAVIPHLDGLADEAGLIGAVNTVVNQNGVLKGFNTDAPGFLRSLELDAGVSPKGKRVMIIGAGGVARAVGIQLALSGAGEIVFTSPYPDEIIPIRQVILKSSRTSVGEVPWGEGAIKGSLSSTDILINATPIGMYPKIADMPPVDIESLPSGVLVCDLIYNPGETLLLQQAKDRGLAVLNGMGMLLYQGAIAFELWTGMKAPLGVMRKALTEALGIG